MSLYEYWVDAKQVSKKSLENMDKILAIKQSALKNDVE